MRLRRYLRRKGVPMENRLSPPPVQSQVVMNFYDALREVIKGEKITRISWNDQGEFGFMHDGFLTIRTKGAFHQWLVSDGDMEATDWVVVGDN